MNKKIKTSLISVGISSLILSTLISTSFTLINNESLKNKEKEILNFIDSMNETKLNNENEMNKEFIKGMDISKYCETIENFLFQNNILKSNGQKYSYKEIYNNYHEGSLISEYINNNLFSYFDSNGNRIYDNFFAILKYYEINSLRIRVWNNPYDKNGNPYGGGTNDIEKAKWIINEARKYDINDFVIDYHFSDFWADPNKQVTPNEWNNLSDKELLKIIYEWTYTNSKDIMDNSCDNKTKIVFQLGNEITKGFMWKRNDDDSFTRRDHDLEIKLLKQSIKAINFLKEKNNNIKLGIGFDRIPDSNVINEWKDIMEDVDTVHFSFYPFWSAQLFETNFSIIKEFNNKYPNIELVIGEFSHEWSKNDSILTNQIHSYKSYDNFNYSVLEQVKITQTMMMFISNLLPNIKTGFYYWEPADISVGSSSWATEEGIKYFGKINEGRNWKTVNNWWATGLFDTNGIALPTLEIIKQFERIDNNISNIFKYDEILDPIIKKSYLDKLIFLNTNFKFNKNFKKINIKNIMMFNYSNKLFTENDAYNIYQPEILDNDIEDFLIQKIKYDFNSLMYEQLEFKNFNLQDNKGQIILKAKDNSFYYEGSMIINFVIHNSWYNDTIYLSDDLIEIDSNDKNWYEKIIQRLKEQPNWKFENDIYKYLKISGGAREDNSIWLYDENKKVNRSAEFFLITNDKVRYKNGLVNYNVLNKKKYWINSLGEKYKKGTFQIYFGIRKEIKEYDPIYNIPSTFSQIGTESWKQIDLLVYKINIKLV